MKRAELAAMIDHTLLRPDATQTDFAKLCEEAVSNGFAAVCVNPAWVSFCAPHVAGSSVKVGAAIGFPLGAATAHVKVEDAREALRHGAGEIDMVINIGALRSGYATFVEQEIAAVVQAVKAVPVKVILETCYLSIEEKIAVCEMSICAGAAFVKTSTGFGRGGATIEDVRLMRTVVGSALGVKAAGGIRTYADACAMIQAGASRIGTSAGVEIVNGATA